MLTRFSITINASEGSILPLHANTFYAKYILKDRCVTRKKIFTLDKKIYLHII